MSTFTGDADFGVGFADKLKREDQKEVETMYDIFGEVRNESQDEMAALWNWLTSLGRNDDVFAMMNNKEVRKSLFEEYQNAMQEK